MFCCCPWSNITSCYSYLDVTSKVTQVVHVLIVPKPLMLEQFIYLFIYFICSCYCVYFLLLLPIILATSISTATCRARGLRFHCKTIKYCCCCCCNKFLILHLISVCHSLHFVFYQILYSFFPTNLMFFSTYIPGIQHPQWLQREKNQ